MSEQVSDTAMELSRRRHHRCRPGRHDAGAGAGRWTAARAADRQPPACGLGRRPARLALAHGSRQLLESLGAWNVDAATAIDTIHVSQRGGFGRTLIDASDYGIAGSAT
jgi:hypothetical protein